MPLYLEFTLDVSSLDFLSGVVFYVKIGKISTIFQPKALIPKHKNQIFQNFFNCLAGFELLDS